MNKKAEEIVLRPFVCSLKFNRLLKIGINEELPILFRRWIDA